jgi:hypothetical protein
MSLPPLSQNGEMLGAPARENEPLPPDAPLNGVGHGSVPLPDQPNTQPADLTKADVSAAVDTTTHDTHLMPPPPLPNMAADPPNTALRLPSNPPSARSSYILYDGQMERNPTAGSDTQYHSSNSRPNSTSSTSRRLLPESQDQSLPARRSAAPKLISIATKAEQLPKSFRSAEDVKQATRSVSNSELDSAASDGHTPKSSPMRPNFQSDMYSPYLDSTNPIPKECVAGKHRIPLTDAEPTLSRSTLTRCPATRSSTTTRSWASSVEATTARSSWAAA